ncbi:MAG: hypothetical protein KGL39_05270 [Patescibacteria group bacterium]|nr:hypothetical protein [Patescibacteria group bacterium]
MRALVMIATLLASASAIAHDQWSNGEPVPKWIKQYCCSNNEVHRIDAGAVHLTDEGFMIDGNSHVIDPTHVFPSQDGDYWAFFAIRDGEPGPVWCFFAPVTF